MADVFLSYARQDAVIALKIAERLRASGYSVWFDAQLPAHRPYSDVIAAELETAAAVVVIWSGAAVQSQWVRSEANRARERGTLVQTRVDAVRLPMPFDQIQCADLRSWRGGKSSIDWSNVTNSVAALVANEGPNEVTGRDAPQRSGVTRRTLWLAAGATAAVGLAGFAGWQSLGRHEASPEAEAFLQKGFEAFRSADILEPDDPQSVASAIGFFSAATRADPRSATAWGALALAYAGQTRAVPLTQRAALESRSRSAARTALDLDPREPRAIGALRLLDPVYRHWLKAESADRAALQQNPGHSMLLAILGWLLADVGRWRDSAKLFNMTDAQLLLNPAPVRKLVLARWAAEDLQTADDLLRKALDYWPDHPQLWRTRVSYLIYTGRVTEAFDVLANNPPQGVSSAYVDAISATARAMAGRLAAPTAVTRNLEYLKSAPMAVFEVAHACASLGALNVAMDLLHGYYYAEGEWAPVAPLGGDDDRVTAPILMPPMRNLWPTAAFNEVLEHIGLNDYWRRSSTKPDFRRG